MKFIESFEDIQAKLITLKSLMIVFVDPSILTPSESLLKYLSANRIGQELEKNIFVYKGVDARIF